MRIQKRLMTRLSEEYKTEEIPVSRSHFNTLKASRLEKRLSVKHKGTVHNFQKRCISQLSVEEITRLDESGPLRVLKE